MIQWNNMDLPYALLTTPLLMDIQVVSFFKIFITNNTAVNSLMFALLCPYAWIFLA